MNYDTGHGSFGSYLKSMTGLLTFRTYTVSYSLSSQTLYSVLYSTITGVLPLFSVSDEYRTL